MAELPAKTIAESRLTFSRWMNASDANKLGFVHGGVIMSLIDNAGALVASRHAGRAVVTAALDSLFFFRRIHLGDLVTLISEITYVGRTSMETRVEVYAEDLYSGESELTNIAYLVFVALDPADEAPTPVPPLRFETEKERIASLQAKERRKRRLEQKELAILNVQA